MGDLMNKIIGVFFGLVYSITLLIKLIFLRNNIIHPNYFVCMFTCVMLIDTLLKSQKHKKMLLVLSFVYLVLTIMSILYTLFAFATPKYEMVTFIITVILIIFQPIAFYYIIGQRDIKKD